MTPEATRVRITTDPALAHGCVFVGTVTDDRMEDLQGKAARLGGNLAVVTMQTESARGRGSAYGFGFRYVTYTTASIYRCPG